MTFFLPYMSARRPVTGIVTAAARSVAVTAHEALAGSVPSSLGSSLWIGITRDCMSAPEKLPKASTMTTSAVGNVVSTGSATTEGECMGWSSCRRSGV